VELSTHPPLRLVAVGDSLTAGTQDANTVQERQRFVFANQLARAAGMEFNLGLIGGEGLPFTVFGDVGFDQKKFSTTRLRLARALVPLALYTYYLGVLPFVPPVWDILGLGSRTPESKSTRERPQTNFGVPGFEIRQLTDIRGVRDLLREMNRGTEKVDGLASTIPWTKALLQNGSQFSRGSQVDQAVAARPDLVVFWAGSNDALSTVFEPRIDDRTLTPVEDRPWTFQDADLVTGRTRTITTEEPVPGFRTSLHRALDRLLKETQAEIVLCNLPDVTVVPILRPMGQKVGTLPFRVLLSDGTDVTGAIENWVVPDRRPDGTKYPPGSRVSLITILDKFLAQSEISSAQELQTRLDSLAGQPVFTEDEVLDPAEMLAVTNRIHEYNQVLADAAATHPRLHLVDVHGAFNLLSTVGRPLRGEGDPVVVTNTFTGVRDPQGREGIFSYDGVHPSDTGHAVVANLILDKLKQDFAGHPRFGYIQNVPPVDEKAVYAQDPHRQRGGGTLVLDRSHVGALKLLLR
jgi:lysophospholipase L1-like esterase